MEEMRTCLYGVHSRSDFYSNETVWSICTDVKGSCRRGSTTRCSWKWIPCCVERCQQVAGVSTSFEMIMSFKLTVTQCFGVRWQHLQAGTKDKVQTLQYFGKCTWFLVLIPSYLSLFTTWLGPIVNRTHLESTWLFRGFYNPVKWLVVTFSQSSRISLPSAVLQRVFQH